jgi:hypothetical protein
MSYRVPIWYRGIGAQYYTQAIHPPHRVEGTKMILHTDEGDRWYDDWAYLVFKFVELKPYLDEQKFRYTPGSELFFFTHPEDIARYAKNGFEYEGRWDMRTFLDFEVPGEGAIFAMWARTAFSMFEERRNSPFERQTLPRSDKPFEGFIPKTN